MQAGNDWVTGRRAWRVWAAGLAGGVMVLVVTVGASAHGCGGKTACILDTGLYHIDRADTPTGAALVFLHGWGGSGAVQRRDRGLVDAFRRAGFAVITPTGQPRGQGRGGHRWNSFAAEHLRDDGTFLRAVADDAAERFDLDRTRFLLGGFSGGGMMAWRVACDAPDSFRAYLPIAGLLWRPLPKRCSGPIRLLHTHGWQDRVVPIEGRVVGNGILEQGDLGQGLALLRRANRCTGDAPDRYDTSGPFWYRAWTDCHPGAFLAFALFSGGHTIPAGWTDLALAWLDTLPVGR